MKNEFILLMTAVCFGANTQAMEANYEQVGGVQAQPIVQQSANKRHRWTPEEDKLLSDLVKKYGARNWAVIEKQMPGRTGKRCRERWINRLAPNIMQPEWTREDDENLIRLHKEIGSDWTVIGRSLNRTGQSVKNRWQVLEGTGATTSVQQPPISPNDTDTGTLQQSTVDASQQQDLVFDNDDLDDSFFDRFQGEDEFQD